VTGGKLLKDMAVRGERPTGRLKKESHAATLSDLGISNDESSRFQRAAEALVEHCRAQVPGCTPPEIMAAMRQVAGEQLAEADQLERFGRCRKAGITGVVPGGKP